MCSQEGGKVKEICSSMKKNISIYKGHIKHAKMKGRTVKTGNTMES